MIATPITTPCRDRRPMLQPKTRSRHHVAIHVAISWSCPSGPEFHQIANRLPHQPHRIRTPVRSLVNSPAPDPGRLAGIHGWKGCDLPPPWRSHPHPRRRFFGSIPRISAPSSPNLASSSPNLSASSPNLPEQRDLEGCLASGQLPCPVVDDLAPLSGALRSRLEAMASEPRTKRKVDRQVLIDVVLQLCEGRFITLRCLAELVNRKPDTLRDQYLKVLVRQRQLNLAFPKTPNHVRQAYTTVKPSTP